MASQRSEGPFRLFFKIILQGNNLRLPLRFVNQYRNELGGVAQLTASDGRVWKMKVRREGKQIWLENGFPEFIKHYSIGYGHLLTFKYQSLSNFSVDICDKSGCEIEYPQREEVEQEAEILEESSEESLHILECPLGHREAPSAEQVCQRKGKRKTDTSFLNHGEASKRRKTQPKIAQVHRQQEIMVGRKFNDMLSKSSGKTKTLVEFAMKIKPRNPSFLVIILKNNIRNGVLSLPSVFAKRYMRDYSKIMIQNANDYDGRKWTIEKLFWKDDSLRLEKGLREFYRDNSLEGGDVCLFQLVRAPNVVLKASRFHTFAQSFI